MRQDLKNCNALKFSFKNVINAGRLKCCGMEDRTVGAHGCQKTKKLYVVWKRTRFQQLLILG